MKATWQQGSELAQKLKLSMALPQKNYMTDTCMSHRILNPLVKGSSPVTPSTQATENKEVTSLKEDGGNPENPELVSGLFFESENDPDLKLFIQRWPKLPEHIRAAIKALVQTHKTEVK